MIYEAWEDADGNYHKISEMDTKYIKNCKKQVEIAIQTYCVSADEGREEISGTSYDVLGKEWSKKFANGFLDTFNRELEIRNRIKKKDYPAVVIDENCSTCGNSDCDEREKRNKCEWYPQAYCVINKLDGVDAEIARRSGFICNDIKYKYE